VLCALPAPCLSGGRQSFERSEKLCVTSPRAHLWGAGLHTVAMLCVPFVLIVLYRSDKQAPLLNFIP